MIKSRLKLFIKSLLNNFFNLYLIIICLPFVLFFQVMPGASSIDMIDTSPGPKARVSTNLFFLGFKLGFLFSVLP